MKAVDTNILIRWVTRDDPTQVIIADKILSQPVFVSATVLVEVAWVLGGKTFDWDRAAIARAMDIILDLSTIEVAAEDDVRWAVERFRAGADFDDMLHLVTSRGNDAFVSFEKHLAKLAGPDTPIRIERAA